MNKYHIFGFIVESDFYIPNVLIADKNASADVRIRLASLQQQGVPTDQNFYSRELMYFKAKEVALFRITNGNLIEVEPLIAESDFSHLVVFLLGAGMGGIIHQRGLLPIHGSCVTDGSRTILLSGTSGAGKSTMASEFLAHGWKLLTDDVAIIKDIEGVPVVQSSYPSQKLWPDSMKQYEREQEKVHSLYSRSDGDIKYGVDVSEIFVEGAAPLSMFVRLAAEDDGTTGVYPVEGMAGVNQFMLNTYRKYMIDKRDYQQLFQRCVSLGSKVPVCLAMRKKGAQTASILYEEILAYYDKLKGNNE